MQNLRKAVLAFIFVLLLITPFAFRQEKPAHIPKRHFYTTLAEDRVEQETLVQLVNNINVVKNVQYLNAVKLVQDTVAAQKAAQAKKHVTVHSNHPTASGDCYAMAPAGFPSYIIERESSNTATADNGSHYGCAQLDYSYLTGNYKDDWARLWADGRGACHWNPPNYCA